MKQPVELEFMATCISYDSGWVITRMYNPVPAALYAWAKREGYLESPDYHVVLDFNPLCTNRYYTQADLEDFIAQRPLLNQNIRIVTSDRY